MTTVYFYNPKIDYSPVLKENVSKTAQKIVKILAAKSLSKAENELEFEISENGKPHFKGIENFHFNISHCENAITVAVSDRPVGIDIEKLREADFRVSERFFTENEKKYVGSCDRRFFEIWTKKEAYIKKHGLALKNLKDALSDNVFTTEIDGFIISVCENSDINTIVLEKLEDL